jgi:integrase
VRHQNGYIWHDRRRKCWFGRWYEDQLQSDGTVKRVQQSRKLADYGDRYRAEKDVRPLLSDILRPMNEGRMDARSTMTLAQFVEGHYLPYVERELKPATYDGYRKLWRQRLRTPTGNIVLRDFTTKHGHDVLSGLRDDGLGRRSIYHARAFISGIFSHAINLGVLNGQNPVSEVKLPRTKPPQQTHGYTAQEVQDMLVLFETQAREGKIAPEQAIRARAAIGLMFFAGLRPGEARGMEWPDYNGKTLVVNRSVWRTKTTTPKTEDSIKPVPVIEPLRSILAELREMDGNPQTGPVLRGIQRGRPLNLDMLAREVVIPALRASNKPWYGWYACRRGIGTMLATITRDPNASKGLLRHSSLATTIRHYVLDVPEVTLHGMEQVEQLFGSRGTPVADPAATMQQRVKQQQAGNPSAEAQPLRTQ